MIGKNKINIINKINDDIQFFERARTHFEIDILRVYPPTVAVGATRAQILGWLKEVCNAHRPVRAIGLWLNISKYHPPFMNYIKHYLFILKIGSCYKKP